MPGGRLNFSRIFRIVSVFLVRQTMVSRMLLLFMSAEVSVRLDFPEPDAFLVPSVRIVTFWHSVTFRQFPALQVFIRLRLSFDGGQFLCPLGQELLEEGVAYPAGVECGVAVVINSGLVAGEEEHEFRELVCPHLGGKGVGEDADAVGQRLVGLGACAEEGGDLDVYPVGGFAMPVGGIVVHQRGARGLVGFLRVVGGVSPMYGVVGTLHVRRAWVARLEGRYGVAPCVLARRGGRSRWLPACLDKGSDLFHCVLF